MRNAAYKILVVDDEPDLETLVVQRFRQKIRDGEYHFVFARDGQQAIDVVERDPDIDIVMSDINMPVMDGLTLLSRLGDLNRILKIVIVSAYGDIHNIRTAMNRGAYDFLTKPIDFQDFEVTIQKTIRELNVRKEGQKAREQLMALQQELGIATRIQQSMLPRTFPAFPGRNDFEIYAEMLPARSVGGDFYDYFLIDRDRLGFVIGDVSGKGIPAAIFMAVCRTLLRATAMQGVAPGECLKYMNSVLVRQCDPAMYVTVFYGILNTASGEIEYSCGGHNTPYVLASGGGVSPIDATGGLVVGAFERANYETGRLRLNPGDAMLLYTDGVTDAEDARGECFSEERLDAALERTRTSPAEEIIRELIADVMSFSAGAAQGDDITAMALRYLRCDPAGDVREGAGI